ncbi:MAG: hypothetical protein ABFD12_10325, partial [Syntrophorhabdus sp.]
ALSGTPKKCLQGGWVSRRRNSQFFEGFPPCLDIRMVLRAFKRKMDHQIVNDVFKSIFSIPYIVNFTKNNTDLQCRKKAE